MARTEFILQGLTPKSHIDAVQRLFDLPDIESLLLGVAFVNESGVRQIDELVKACAAQITAIVGIRNGATSYQGLVRLYGIVDNLYTADTGTRAYIFHPKLFLARGKALARLLVGSANITLAGLSKNIEAGLLQDFDLTDDSDKSLIDEIETQFDSALRNYPDNILKINKIADLDELLATGRLIDETDTMPPDLLDRADEAAGDNERGISRNNSNPAVPRMKLNFKPLHDRIVKASLRMSTTDERKASTAEVLTPTATHAHETSGKLDAENANTCVPNYRYRFYSEGTRKRAARLRREASARGDTTYFTGYPCRYGHIDDRFVCNGKCRECNRQDSEQANRLGLYR